MVAKRSMLYGLCSLLFVCAHSAATAPVPRSSFKATSTSAGKQAGSMRRTTAVEYNDSSKGKGGGQMVHPVMDDPPAARIGTDIGSSMAMDDTESIAHAHHMNASSQGYPPFPLSVPSALMNGVNPFGKTIVGSDEAIDSIMNYPGRTMPSPEKTHPSGVPVDCESGEIEADEVRRLCPQLSPQSPLPLPYEASQNLSDLQNSTGMAGEHYHSAGSRKASASKELSVDKLQTDMERGQLPTVLKNVAMKRINVLKSRIQQLKKELSENNNEMDRLQVFTGQKANPSAKNASKTHNATGASA